MNTFVNGVPPNFSKQSFSRFLLRELRSDHAGETGAVFIYRGVLAVSRDSNVRSFAQDHLATEMEHLNFFEQWLPPNQHSKLIVLWKLSGIFLGAFSTLMGKKVLFLTITDKLFSSKLSAIKIGMFLSATLDLTFSNFSLFLPAIAHLILVDANFLNRYSTTNFPVNEVAPQIIISNCFIYPKIKKNGYTTCSITV